MKNNKQILYIKIPHKEQIYLALFSTGKIKEFNKKIISDKISNELLYLIEIFLKEHKTNIKKLNAIVVYSGPGSYTSLRVGVLTANALAWALNIPIFAIKKHGSFKQSLSRILKKINIKKVFSKPVKVYYQQAIE